MQSVQIKISISVFASGSIFNLSFDIGEKLEIYNLAAQSHVKVSFETPEYTADSDGIGTLRLLEAIRILGLEGHTRFYQASTSELFGKVRETHTRLSFIFHPLFLLEMMPVFFVISKVKSSAIIASSVHKGFQCVPIVSRSNQSALLNIVAHFALLVACNEASAGASVMTK